MRSAPMRLLLLAASAFLVGGMAAPQSQTPVVAAPQFDAIRFFEGRTEGEGILKVVLKEPNTVRVRSLGRVERDGTLVLRQTVTESGKPARQREWRMRQVAPGRYTGTLSDATGPVTAEATGDRLHLKFRMKGGLNAEQWLTLTPGGRAAQNRMVVRKFGVTVASLDETIRKVGS